MDSIDYQIVGDDMQYVEIQLPPGKSAIGEVGSMMYLEDGIAMDAVLGDGAGSGGFVDKLVRAGRRMVAGSSAFMTVYTNTSNDRRKLAFAASFPGKIMAIDLAHIGGAFISQRESFLCAARGVAVGIAFQRRLGAGFFGGEGFVMQKLEGDGLAFIHAGGALMERELANGELLRVDAGCLVAMQATVDYNIQYVGKIKTALFGGEGLFFATLRGPGKVILQSLPFSRLANRIYAAAPPRRTRRDEG